MTGLEPVVGQVVRDAHDGFWIVLDRTHFLPVSRQIEDWLRANLPAQGVTCAWCKPVQA